ncbi:hypothetical protein EUTSA_v10016112mg [Eutrema salsugineum]|uniref:Uncharacterized protein n=1 Tax=Eutrema salsugineum TaxID=72664 RepID=V4L9J0_EUTSA|nr:hypothetical protein EUTSA_v10016112mg [Eutrema salsugineum]
MEDARLVGINHLAGKETVKRALGRATRVVDPTGKKDGERIQTIESHRIHPLAESGLAGILTQRKKPMLVTTNLAMKTNQLGEIVTTR